MANELHLPVGRPVRIQLKSNDVIHSFWVPNLHGKMDLIPGRETVLWLQADRPGVYRGQCAEYCGLQHAHMAFVVEALPPEEFVAWVAQRQQPPAEPAGTAGRGQQAFFRHGCAVCHTIRGTPADGQLGPDLTHVGGRMSLGAGILPNNVGTIAGWIAGAQHIKPANKMPSFNTFSGEELRAIAAWLASLE